MILKSIEYTENKGQPKEWQLKDCTLEKINLMVGRNATGKTRILNVLSLLKDILSGTENFRKKDNNFILLAIFESNGMELKYEVDYKGEKVVKEKLIENGKILLNRYENGSGKIFAKKLNTDIEFQPPSNELALISRRDTIQHPFLIKYYDWGKSARYFQFGTDMGQDNPLIFISYISKEGTSIENENHMAGIFHKGSTLFGDKYIKLIMEDMKKIDYNIEDISLQTRGGVISEGISKEYKGIRIKEKELNTPTFYYNISTGMFRTLSLLIQINYFLLDKLPSCIIIDDIGEGLDYGRSTDLIKLLIEKVKKTDIQLIMSSNDRFIMNGVPLEYWSVIQRFANKTVVYNYKNSKSIFDDFEFTGLSNFDFFSSNYLFKNSMSTSPELKTQGLVR